MNTKSIIGLLLFTFLVSFSSCKSDDSDAPCTVRTWYIDADNDGYGVITGAEIEACNQPSGYAVNADDCNDADAGINPGVTEIPDDGIDSDCDGTIEYNIWSGPMMTFTKADFADWTLEANQDRITLSVMLTRADTQGIFNIASEVAYVDEVSPFDTEWSYGTTADISSLTFEPWEIAVGGTPPAMVNQDMVVHLIPDGIYIDIKFTSWSGGGSGGGFSYERSTED